MMVRIARERVADLFALAERESQTGRSALANRYVQLARRVGTRYNVRLPPEYRERYCRGCSSYWVEGRTVRTRLRRGRRLRTCLVCGRERRTLLRKPRPATSTPGLPPTAALLPEGALAIGIPEEDDESDPEGDEEAS
jgi:ribonuclease P protein subunit RPR2